MNDVGVQGGLVLEQRLVLALQGGFIFWGLQGGVVFGNKKG